MPVNNPSPTNVLDVYNSNALNSAVTATTWTDLDLSSIIGASARVVCLKVGNNNIGSEIAFRTNGDTDDMYSAGGASGVMHVDVPNTDYLGVILVTDSNGIIEYYADAADTYEIDVIWAI